MMPAVSDRSPMVEWLHRHPVAVVLVAPVIPQIIGTIFNTWYNLSLIEPLLKEEKLHGRFFQTVIVYNLLFYPAAIALWVLACRPLLRALRQGAGPAHPADLQRRLINLPWTGSLIAAVAWFACIPVFLGSLYMADDHLDSRLWSHLPISFLVSGFIAVTHSFFLVELATQRLLFPLFFEESRPAQTPGAFPLSLRGRGFMWAVSAGLCPIGSLLLLAFAPGEAGSSREWLALFVGTVGISFGLCTAIMMGKLVAEPVDHLRRAAQALAGGRLDIHVPLLRADEFGILIDEFNRMIGELREKEKLRETFGIHVGRRAAAEILRRDPGLGGVEETVTVMFVDVRNFTARCAKSGPREIVRVLNEFLGEMVDVVEEKHHGLINKFLGDGFMALFGAGDTGSDQADAALEAAQDIRRRLGPLNERLRQRGEEPVAIGIGLHTGPAIVGSVGAPQRLEFTAIGDTVNMASRLEGLTKTVGETLVLSAAARAALKKEWTLQPLGAHAVKGAPHPLEIFTLAEPT
jgi:adenylate cyclase